MRPANTQHEPHPLTHTAVPSWLPPGSRQLGLLPAVRRGKELQRSDRGDHVYDVPSRDLLFDSIADLHFMPGRKTPALKQLRHVHLVHCRHVPRGAGRHDVRGLPVRPRAALHGGGQVRRVPGDQSFDNILFIKKRDLPPII